MNYGSPHPSVTHNEPDQLHSFYSGNHFPGHYGLNLLPRDDLFSLQEPLTPSTFYDMAEMEAIKPESEWEAPSSSTPDSDETWHSDLPIATHSAQTRSAKNRRNPSTSTASTASTILSNDLNRERNRIAASKCRRKKKVEETQLEERWRILQVQNVILQDSASQLRNEVFSLKNEILKHGTCEFPPIQSYIKAAAAAAAAQIR
ncbi:hypothetical protein BKA67DRAFT_663154 [Truncatella angustata]|uniref:BZIP domain-containing protein n=1 Tax=Truncatella angustata TaxID=152316 RepID=A0A9P8UCJ2_9PEZI|nr:uncharacterized protein BKA67DRAFT_663154 [Truncatella angustata]KAH6646761.1 hypothetical protein BKA67DRAFT_663154 [Truncatella angustata]